MPTQIEAVKPFLKWAGGKTQLLDEIDEYLPFDDKNITKYAEPFVGGGAVLFHILNNYELEAIYISDINSDLIDTYISIRDNVDSLVEKLGELEELYLSADNYGRKEIFLDKRMRFNYLKLHPDEASMVEKAALMIFLNRTCFNGLYRVNSKGLYNVPAGRYKNPTICDEKNLSAVSNKLKNVIIVCAPYYESDKFIDDHTFVYFDPPYRPITETAGFTSYTENGFGDIEQENLAKYYDKLCRKGAICLLSNSDPKNVNPDDDFFDDLYMNYKVNRVYANRMINSKSSKRGKITEILVTNREKK